MSNDTEKVYQADPATCVKVAREHVQAAREHLATGDATAARAELDHAVAWLPSWLEREWDDRMTAWMEREGAPRA